MMPHHPAVLGPAILYHLKQGKAVERLTVWFTFGQLHQIFYGDTVFGKHIRQSHPLEIVLGKGLDLEKKIDCTTFEAPWNIDIRTDEQKQAANRALSAPAPTPPEAPEPAELAMMAQLFEPFHALAATEYRLLRRRLTVAASRQSKGQQTNQAPSQDTAHG